MATGMHRDERRAACLVLCLHEQDRKVSAKPVAMRGTTLYVVIRNCSLILKTTLSIYHRPREGNLINKTVMKFLPNILNMCFGCSKEPFHFSTNNIFGLGYSKTLDKLQSLGKTMKVTPHLPVTDVK